MHGERGNPREWSFDHHDPLPGWRKDGYYLQRWAQDKGWKLYEDGRLFQIQTDVLEEHPISTGEDGEDASDARKKLQLVLARMH